MTIALMVSLYLLYCSVPCDEYGGCWSADVYTRCAESMVLYAIVTHTIILVSSDVSRRYTTCSFAMRTTSHAYIIKTVITGCLPGGLHFKPGQDISKVPEP